jgi:hypothetical protein
MRFALPSVIRNVKNDKKRNVKDARSEVVVGKIIIE